MLEQLIGRWTLKRRVISISGNLTATMEGIANFAPLIEGSSRYHEEGAIKMADANQPLIAFSRNYFYRDEQKELAIYFDESPLRLFQSIAFTAAGDQLEGSAIHLCSPDTYTSKYQFRLPSCFQSIHQVEGPRKAYTIITDYERLNTT